MLVPCHLNECEEYPKVKQILEKSARGSYQWNLLKGRENWSGSSLSGKAKGWGASYHESRQNFLARMNRGLDPLGCRVETRLVLNVNHRWERRLILDLRTRYGWQEFDWESGLPVVEHSLDEEKRRMVNMRTGHVI